MQERVTHLLPKAAWRACTPQLYLAFWSLSLYDVDVPEELYKEEIKRYVSSPTKKSLTFIRSPTYHPQSINKQP